MTSGRRGQNVEAQGRQEPARSRAVPRPCRCRLGPLLTSPGGERLRWVWGAPGGRAETMSPSGPTPSGFRGLVGRRTNGRRARATTGCGGHWQPLRLRALAPSRLRRRPGSPPSEFLGPRRPLSQPPLTRRFLREDGVAPGTRGPGDAWPRRHSPPGPRSRGANARRCRVVTLERVAGVRTGSASTWRLCPLGARGAARCPSRPVPVRPARRLHALSLLVSSCFLLPELACPGRPSLRSRLLTSCRAVVVSGGDLPRAHPGLGPQDTPRFLAVLFAPLGVSGR